MSLQRPKFKLRTKIIAWSFIPTAIILLLVATMIYIAYQGETERVVISRDRELTRLTAGEVSTSMEEFIDRLNDLASDPHVYLGSPADQQAALTDAQDAERMTSYSPPKTGLQKTTNRLRVCSMGSGLRHLSCVRIYEKSHPLLL